MFAETPTTVAAMRCGASRSVPTYRFRGRMNNMTADIAVVSMIRKITLGRYGGGSRNC